MNNLPKWALLPEYQGRFKYPVHLLNSEGRCKCGTFNRFPFYSDDLKEVTCKKCSGTVERKQTPVINEDLKGKLLHSSWGYDTTWNEFYQITGQTSKTVTAYKVASETLTGGGYSGEEKPLKDHLLGLPVTFRVSGSGMYGLYFVNHKVHGHSFSLSEWDREYYYNTVD